MQDEVMDRNQEEDSLFPADPDELTEEENEETEEVEYRPGIAFDQDFIRDGGFRVLSASGTEAWKQWCVNCLSYDRDAGSPLYSSDFGVSYQEIFRAGTREAAENLLNTEIKEALEADPCERTEQVGNIAFTWDVDALTVEAEVTGASQATIDVQVTIGR